MQTTVLASRGNLLLDVLKTLGGVEYISEWVEGSVVGLVGGGENQHHKQRDPLVPAIAPHQQIPVSAIRR
ncbi:MAG: hypothetical protein OXE87_11850 [Chloroflexi bacterium]|nr:hypothetical protein [Chloroflexota bacterium]